ncbi:MKRN2 opposite strand protein-like [Watersipora subatra]|uniref:MKRN2 opposite strand protein-like n=1 Tax=Watersipora subatra TaxID=2589382 RepID=UPI00355C53B1
MATQEDEVISAEDIQIDISASRLGSSQTSRHSIKCFKHCSKFVFCFELPDYCPVCNLSVLGSEILVPPSVYKSPLDHGLTSQPTVLVRPSKGKSFLHDYANGDDLHCGLMDENGLVHDFTENGLSTSEEWLNCIHAPIDYSPTLVPMNTRLCKLKTDWLAKNVRYHPETANCFGFVLFCLRGLGLYTDMNEEEFISEVIIPRTSEAARYIAIYRQLVSGGGILVQQTQN